MSSTYVAHCTTDEQVLGCGCSCRMVSRMRSTPDAGGSDASGEYAERRLADLTGWDTTTESVIDRLASDESGCAVVCAGES